MGIIEEVVGKIFPRLFCHNRPKILAFLDQKMLKPLSVNAFILDSVSPNSMFFKEEGRKRLAIKEGRKGRRRLQSNSQENIQHQYSIMTTTIFS